MRFARPGLLLCVIPLSFGGCSRIVGFIVDRQPEGEERKGITYYVGGAGPIGNVGSFDVPGGLRDAGYRGRVVPYVWQSWTHAGDQINIARNREKGYELADEIQSYRRRYPKNDINIIALSAGTGIATFALEYLPERVSVHNVFFLGCSMSSRYDLTRALKRLDGRLYVLYSPDDQVLEKVVWYTGTVDRSDASEGIAGMRGFESPGNSHSDTSIQYEKLRNVPHRPEFALYGYEGGHTGATSREFVRRYLARALMGRDEDLLGKRYAPRNRRAESVSAVGASRSPTEPR